MGSRAASPNPSRPSSAGSVHSRKGSTSRPTSAHVSRANSFQAQARPPALTITSPTHRLNAAAAVLGATGGGGPSSPLGVTFATSVSGGGCGEDPFNEDLKSPRSQARRQVSFTTSSQLLARRLVELRQEAAS